MPDVTALLTSDGMEIRPNRYLQDGTRTLYKVSTVYPGRVTLILCLENGEVPSRTTVRPVPAERARMMTSASDWLVNQYHDILDAARAQLTVSELRLLRTYLDGPRIWDAADLFAEVCRLAGRGLLEPALTDIGNGPEDRGAYQLTEAGRRVLAEAGQL
jgi:hypothetical protein